MKREKRRD